MIIMDLSTYYARPLKRGLAQRAWDYMLSQNSGIDPDEMFYSIDHIEGPRWVASYPSGTSNSP